MKKLLSGELMENTEVKVCKYCQAEIPTRAKKCKFCGEWVCEQDEELPMELMRFNWGAFLFNWIWGVMNNKYVTLLYFVACLIPVLGPIGISIWFGISGNKWAWQSRKWASIEEFNRVQTNWVRAWFVIVALCVIFVAKFVLLSLLFANVET
jgi:hypothetical protein